MSFSVLETGRRSARPNQGVCGLRRLGKIFRLTPRGGKNRVAPAHGEGTALLSSSAPLNAPEPVVYCHAWRQAVRPVDLTKIRDGLAYALALAMIFGTTFFVHAKAPASVDDKAAEPMAQEEMH